MPNNLEVDFLGSRLRSPFVLASAPPTRDYEAIKKAFEAGWAGAVIKSVVEVPLKDKQPRIGHVRYGGRIIGTQNYEMGSVYSPEQWSQWIDQLLDEFPDRMIFN